MERLTKRIPGGIQVEGRTKYMLEHSDSAMKHTIWRLAAYEDTGLSPEQVAELATAHREGRVVVLPPFADENHDGLKTKYFVYKARNGEPVDNCFVLRPEKDDAARYAVLTYAGFTSNLRLKRDLNKWIHMLRHEEAEAALKAQEGQ